MTARHAIEGLASNPAAPSCVLLRLLALGDHWIVSRLSYRTTLPTEVAEAMVAHSDRRVRTALAQSWTVDPGLRARLLDGLASDALAVAMGPHPYRMEGAPLPDWAYERLLTHERGTVRYEAVNAPTAPAHVLVPLAVHDDPLFRLAACRRVWHALTDDVRTSLLDDTDPAVRTAASLHVMHDDEGRTAELVETLAGDWRLGDVAEWGRLGRPQAESLAAKGVWLERLVRNPAFPADLARELASHDDPAVRLAVSSRPELSEAERAAIDWQVGPEDRLGVLRWVWDARGDTETLRRCATSAHTWLRRSAAMCRELPDDCVDLLAGDADFGVRLLLAENHPDAPAELLLDLYLHGEHRAVAMLASKPQFPVDGLAGRFADAAAPEARALVMRDPGATPDVIERLSRDPAARVRETAACDPRLPVPRLLELLDDPDVGAAAASNPALPIAHMSALLDRAGIAG
ncbi:hypothetical protein [Streptomyces sp. ALB3]|uniref:hypothetical protein n=1 Tax=Streptomyces sp. ALB3 TaxID=3374278 RepID=UPI003792A251